MKALLKSLPLVLFAVATTASAQDPEVRRQAVELLERAHAASLSPNLPNLERVDSFRVLDSSSGPREGTFSRVVVQGAGRREETTFGDYHALDILTQGHIATVRTSELPPAEVETVLRATPISLVRFDGEDVIHRIVTKAVAGKNARCIEFDTVRGQKIDNNELCFDAANNTLLLQKTGDVLIENGDFFPFAGALMPGKIVYSFAGIRKLEISQTMTDLKDASENVLAAPPDAQIRTFCKTFRRPIGVSMPQPKPGNGGRDIDVAVRGIIGMDGKIHEAVVQSAERADLGAEALNLVQQWVFTPGICDGNPNTNEATFIVHFHGR
jgi:Gram-negative bacterial TonB protein C-terminal